MVVGATVVDVGGWARVVVLVVGSGVGVATVVVAVVVAVGRGDGEMAASSCGAVVVVVVGGESYSASTSCDGWGSTSTMSPCAVGVGDTAVALVVEVVSAALADRSAFVVVRIVLCEPVRMTWQHRRGRRRPSLRQRWWLQVGVVGAAHRRPDARQDLSGTPDLAKVGAFSNEFGAEFVVSVHDHGSGRGGRGGDRTPGSGGSARCPLRYRD